MKHMQSGYWKFGQWKGIPFLFHWTILLWLPWSMWQYKSWSWILPSFVAYIALLFIHEMGHAIAARLTRTKVFTLKLFFMHGQCVHEEPYYESDHIWIAWGGVLAQLGILLITVSIQQMLQWLRLYIPSLLVPLFHVFIQVNFFIIIINLLPVAPLDGHVAWRILPLLWATPATQIPQRTQAYRQCFKKIARYQSPSIKGTGIKTYCR